MCNKLYNINCLLQYLLKWRTPLRIYKVKFIFYVFWLTLIHGCIFAGVLSSLIKAIDKILGINSINSFK